MTEQDIRDAVENSELARMSRKHFDADSAEQMIEELIDDLIGSLED